MNGAPATGVRAHGDRFARGAQLDFAVNVWHAPRPARLRKALVAAAEDTSYPDESAARAAIARAHRRPPAEVLPLAGACEGFWLIAHALPGAHAACVHPSFGEGEAALRSAGVRVTRVARSHDGWALVPEAVPDCADIVVLGNPNNPTGTLEDPATIVRLARAGRILVVDESFIDFVQPARFSLAARRDVPGLVILRSLTKAWGLAGIRAGYLLGPASVVRRLAAHRQPWGVSAPALAAIAQCVGDHRRPRRLAAEVARCRGDLCERLAAIPEVTVWPSAANFVLVKLPGHGPAVVRSLARARIAVRPCGSFPGLGGDYIRIAVRTPPEHQALAEALRRAIRAARASRQRVRARELSVHPRTVARASAGRAHA